MMNYFKMVISNFFYSNRQVSLVIILALLLMPITVYGCVFFTAMPDGEMDFYTKYGAIFTAIGAISTVINAVVVIFLMLWLHRRESSLSLLPQISELRKNLIDIHHTLSTEIEYFKEKKYGNQKTINDNGESGFKVYYSPYKHEIQNLNLIIERMDTLYRSFIFFRKKFQSHPDINLDTYKKNLQFVDLINEILVLRKPSTEYKKGLFIEDDLDIDAEDMIEAAKENSLKSINELIDLLKPNHLTNEV